MTGEQAQDSIAQTQARWRALELAVEARNYGEPVALAGRMLEFIGDVTLAASTDRWTALELAVRARDHGDPIEQATKIIWWATSDDPSYEAPAFSPAEQDLIDESVRLGRSLAGLVPIFGRVISDGLSDGTLRVHLDNRAVSFSIGQRVAIVLESGPTL